MLNRDRKSFEFGKLGNHLDMVRVVVSEVTEKDEFVPMYGVNIASGKVLLDTEKRPTKKWAFPQ
jgi:hypothetical protein